MSARLLGPAAFVAALSFSAFALAQAQLAPTEPVKPQPTAPNMPAPQNTVPEKVESTGSTGTLSEKLDRSGGVITPQGNVDPGITAKPPVADPGSTVVIPAPGTPGGNQSVQPK